MSKPERYRLIEQLPDLLPDAATQTWLGTDLTLNRPVTIRLTEVDSEPGLRLRLQTQSLASLEHPGLLHILDSYTQDRQLAIVTEQLPQHTLAEELSDDGVFPRLTEQEALQAVVTVADALHALHCAGFTHGGVSAAQVGRRREGGFILLTGPPTADAVNIPAPRKADVRSVAALAHELLVGEPPESKANKTWRIDPAISPVVKPVLAKAGSVDDCWPDAAALVSAFNKAADELALEQRESRARLAKRPKAAKREAQVKRGKVVGARPASGRSIAHWYRQGWAAVLAVVIGGAVLLGGGWWLLARSDDGAGSGGTDTAQTATTPDGGAAGAGNADGGAADTSANGAGADGETDSADANGNTSGNTATPPVTPSTSPPEVTRVPAEIARITDFDPLGDDVIEHPERLLSINNGDPLTGWNTSRYNTSRFGGLKDGVGLLVELGGEETAEIAQVSIESLSTGWTFQLFASPQRRATQIEWDDPIAEQTVGPNRGEPVTLDLAALPASTLLVWITDLGDELDTGGFRVTITGIRVSRYHNP